ncbi:MAG TPA: response regulator [Rhizomicrobium sp.]|jgi:CheY-like chemotaxis protein
MTGACHILCVDDEEDIRDVVRLCLEMADGFVIDVCTSGAEAVAFLEKARPDLVLLDVMMPGMDGPATLAALRGTAHGKTVPVVFMTARIREAEIAQYLALGAAGVVPKPFNPATLAEDVRRLWRESLEKISHGT